MKYVKLLIPAAALLLFAGQATAQNEEELQRAAEETQGDGEEAEQQLTAAELEELRRDQEQQQAMEQWLRRIPNDPGALLRNKFRYQYQKTGKDQDGNNTWPDDEVQPW